MSKKQELKTNDVKKTSRFYDDIFNTRIRKLLEDRNIKTKDFANKIYVTPEAVRLWCAGYSRPDISKIKDIADFFDVSTDYLLGNAKSDNRDYTQQMTYEKFGITDKTMEILSKLVENKELNNENEFKLNMINYIVQDKFVNNELLKKIICFFKAKDNELKINDEIKEQYEITSLEVTKYLLIQVFEQFMNNSYIDLWKDNGIKHTNLFEMSKERKSKKRGKK